MNNTLSYQVRPPIKFLVNSRPSIFRYQSMATWWLEAECEVDIRTSQMKVNQTEITNPKTGTIWTWSWHSRRVSYYRQDRTNVYEHIQYIVDNHEAHDWLHRERILYAEYILKKNKKKTRARHWYRVQNWTLIENIRLKRWYDFIW